jgi:acid phosphatase type 7
MPRLDRRAFGSSLASLVGGLSLCHASWGEEIVIGASEKAEAKPPLRSPGLDSMFLTWQDDPTTTMTIQWVGTPGSEGTAIRYSKLEDEEWHVGHAFRKPFPDTELEVHRCELTELEPGAEYRFQVGCNPAEFRFRTMPSKANDTIQFVSGGDAGTGSSAIATNILAAKQEPWFALIGGDLAYDNGTSPGTFLKFLENYRRHMVDPQGRLIPMLSCLGNHEVKGGYRGDRSKSPHYLSVFDGLFSETTYGVLDIGDYLSLVLLDTGHLSPIAGEQTDWLSRCLAERQDRPHLIVANHVPAYPSHRQFDNGKGGGTGAENRRHWVPLFERYNVDLVLEHHDHTYKRTHPLKDGCIDKNGVLYLGDGSWGKLRAPTEPENRPYLARASKAYHVTVHRLEGDQRFHVALEENGKVADVCTTVSKRVARRG